MIKIIYGYRRGGSVNLDDLSCTELVIYPEINRTIKEVDLYIKRIVEEHRHKDILIITNSTEVLQTINNLITVGKIEYPITGYDFTVSDKEDVFCD